ncbi:aldehyde ferredoxin oxidoreductase [Desulfosarcina ovata subsp. sediminis]|uniref:Aldehyde ferredoxin oxidoreductase n=1 Tax=Desulfosarcina ovata subsp. sediminis TaxID=885957 RepID=A0A5K8A140_9BACT|nr:aldehyde ferredoxin oxidoreductase N-terminal domain-containing protein [Desulfosarcina ovata]BBO86040.1 aldehyde ferredoxin oxidoreductase [Desulfosarcina ovata subsp. sediminis]
MRYAETGYNLEVDLATGNIERVQTDPKLAETLLGGLGTCLKIMWDRTTPDTHAFDPENPLIISSGLMAGTPAFSSNRTLICTLSPKTNLLAYPMGGGFFAPELKYAGYDKIIFTNKSPKWVYLWVHNDKVEIRDAEHLLGTGAIEAQDLIREELDEPNAQVAAIGTAGELKSYIATVEMGRGSASRMGAASVWGDKKIKAVAVRGTKDVNLADGPAFLKALKEMRDFVDERNHNRLSSKNIMDIHTGVGSPQAMEIVDESWHTGGFSWGNARYRKKDFWNDELEEAWTKIQYGAIQRFISCYACPQQCGALIWHEEDPPYMAKCYSKLSYLFGSETEDQNFSWKILSKSFRYGVDSFSTPQVLAMAVEMRRDGVLKEEDFAATDEYPACPPPEEKQEVFLWILDRIGKGQGIGKILALGTKAAAEKIGVNPEHYAHNITKGEEQMNVKLGMLDPMYFLMFATNEKQSVPQIEGNWTQDAFRDPKDREEFVKDWIHLPHERFIKYFLDWEPKSREGGPFMNPEYPTPEIASDIVDWMEEIHNYDDSLGICCGMGGFCLKPAYHVHNYYKFVSTAAGIDVDQYGLRKIIHRSRNLHRAFQMRRGMTRADDAPPADHWRHRFPELEEKLLTTYYNFKGWNDDGVPTRIRLEELDLGYVADELEDLGILKKVETTDEDKETWESRRKEQWGY